MSILVSWRWRTNGCGRTRFRITYILTPLRLAIALGSPLLRYRYLYNVWVVGPDTGLILGKSSRLGPLSQYRPSDYGVIESKLKLH